MDFARQLAFATAVKCSVRAAVPGRFVWACVTFWTVSFLIPLVTKKKSNGDPSTPGFADNSMSCCLPNIHTCWHTFDIRILPFAFLFSESLALRSVTPQLSASVPWYVTGNLLPLSQLSTNGVKLFNHERNNILTSQHVKNNFLIGLSMSRCVEKTKTTIEDVWAQRRPGRDQTGILSAEERAAQHKICQSLVAFSHPQANNAPLAYTRVRADLCAHTMSTNKRMVSFFLIFFADEE